MRNKIKAFREFWLDCYSSALLSMLRSYDEVPYNSVYCNNYEYILSKIDLDNDKKFFSLQSNNHKEEFETALFEDVMFFDFAREENMTEKISKIIKNGMLVFLGVDIFYWIKDNYNWNRNHFNHYALITDYDNQGKKYTVFETGDKGYNEYKVDEKTVIEAAKNFKKNKSIVFKLNDEIDVDLISKKMIKRNANRIINSINAILDNAKCLFAFDKLTDKEKPFVADHIQTHMYSLECRQIANKLLFEKEVGNLELAKEFSIIEERYKKLKNLSIKYNIIESYDNYNEFKEKIVSLLLYEIQIWKKYITDY